ncbi:cell division protein FtsQ [Litorivivens lipolytica]|uniref:Cell division protein FtsQ n=1 Tax=Litorivivens lipolytica TaxID=1524264 RepID=A0A7W4Z529_9GAMM|nr:cell division protein FtsQ/DivIB [Litorivivens lipolytica]MBB3047074.1 cell division protein FtsQ [Litorivivens lipolytica]
MARKPQKGAVRKRRKPQRGERVFAPRFLTVLKPLTLVLLLGALGFGLSRLLMSVGDVSVERVAFAGDIQYAPREQLVKRVNPHLQTGYLGLDLDAIKASVEKEPWVLHARVERVWPRSLKVTIEEQSAIAYWGRKALLNHRGDIFKPKQLPRDLTLPMLNGPDAASVAVMRAYQLTAQLLADTGIELSQFTLDEQGQWSAVTADDVVIRLGREQPVQNMRRFLLVYRETLSTRFAEVQQIDTRYINGIAVDWRGKSS